MCMIYLTNLPSFYKIRLWNEVARRRRLLVVFYQSGAADRNADFFRGEMHFEHVWLRGGAVRQSLQLARLLRRRPYDELVLGGWETPALLAGALLSPRGKNACVVESSVYESGTGGMKGLVKKLFMRRIAKVYACGKPQAALAGALGFRGRVVLTGGCGILNYGAQPAYEPRAAVRRFLYVGRLVEVKNLELLVRTFGEMPDLELTIAGFGPLEGLLKALAGPNVRFLGPVDNDKLPAVYRAADVFVLPSRVEPWGLVVEEALNNGTPVIVSDRVGCKDDLVTAETGLVFRHDDAASLKAAVRQMCDVAFYNRLRLGVSRLDFTRSARRQVEVYLS